MVTVLYGNIALVISFFLIFFNSKNMKDTENKVLEEPLTHLIQQVKRIQNHCKLNNIDLRTVFSEQELKQYEADIAYLKTITPEIKGMSNYSFTGEPDDIGKKEFLKVASEILSQLLQSKDPFQLFDPQLVNNGAYSIDTEKLKTNLGKLKPHTPLGQKFMELFQGNISACTTVDNTQKVLSAILNKFNNKSYLLKHYSNYQTTYNQENSTDELNLAAIFASNLRGDFGGLQHSIKTCVVHAIDDVAFNLNKELSKEEELKKEKEELKKEKTELRKQEFRKAFAAWKAEQKKICSSIISHDTKTDSICNMSKAAFFTALVEACNDWQKTQPLLSKELRVNIMAELKEDAQVKDFVNAMSKSLLSIHTPEEYIYNSWQESQVMPSFDDLKTAIITSSDGTSPYNFIGEYVEWAAEVSGALDSLQLPPTQQFDANKLLKKFEKLFSNKELSIFYPVLKQSIQAIGSPFPSRTDVSEAWQSALYQVTMNSDSVRSLFNSLSFEEKQQIENISNQLRSNAPIDSIKAIFLDSKRPKLSIKPLLAKGEALNLVIKLKDGSVLNSTIFTKIESLNERAYAMPTDISLTVANKNGLEFQATDFYALSPIEHGKEGISCDFEFKILLSKAKGSVTRGSETGSSYGIELGSESSETEVDIDVTNNTLGVEGSLQAPKWIPNVLKKFNPISYLVDGEVSGHYAYDWGKEEGTEKTKGTFNSSNYNRSTSTTQEITEERGVDTSFLVVKGHLYSFNFTSEGTIEVDVNVLEGQITSPDAKGAIPAQLQMTRGKTLHWKK